MENEINLIAQKLISRIPSLVCDTQNTDSDEFHYFDNNVEVGDLRDDEEFVCTFENESPIIEKVTQVLGSSTNQLPNGEEWVIGKVIVRVWDNHVNGGNFMEITRPYTKV